MLRGQGYHEASDVTWPLMSRGVERSPPPPGPTVPYSSGPIDPYCSGPTVPYSSGHTLRQTRCEHEPRRVNTCGGRLGAQVVGRVGPLQEPEHGAWRATQQPHPDPKRQAIYLEVLPKIGVGEGPAARDEAHGVSSRRVIKPEGHARRPPALA